MKNIIVIYGQATFKQDSRVSNWTYQSHKGQMEKNLREKFGNDINIITVHPDAKENPHEIRSWIYNGNQVRAKVWNFSNSQIQGIKDQLGIDEHDHNEVHFEVHAHGNVNSKNFGLPRTHISSSTNEYFTVESVSNLTKEISLYLRMKRVQKELHLRSYSCHFATKEGGRYSSALPPWPKNNSIDLEAKSDSTMGHLIRTNSGALDSITGARFYNLKDTRSSLLSFPTPLTTAVKNAPASLDAGAIFNRVGRPFDNFSS